MHLTKTVMVALLAAACAGLAGNASAEPLSGTLKKIHDDNILLLGYRESSVPLSYVNGKTDKVVGYSHDIAMRIYDAIKKKLDMPKLELREIPITAQNRISLMQNGTIDLGCNGTTNNAERRHQVAFSNTIAITQTQLLVHKNSGIHGMKDLAGKSVAVTAGSTSERYMRQYVQKTGIDTRVVSARDHFQAFIMLQTDRVAAFFMDRNVLAALLSKARHPDDYEITGEPQTREALACMMRKDDPQFKALVDKVIADMQKSGEAKKLYNRWFMSPIPPDGTVLGASLSDSMKTLFAHPNDKSFD